MFYAILQEISQKLVCASCIEKIIDESDVLYLQATLTCILGCEIFSLLGIPKYATYNQMYMHNHMVIIDTKFSQDFSYQ